MHRQIVRQRYQAAEDKQQNGDRVGKAHSVEQAYSETAATSGDAASETGGAD